MDFFQGECIPVLSGGVGYAAYPPAAGRPFTVEEDALLGTMIDREVAERTGRDPQTIYGRRKRLGIRAFNRR